MRPESGEARLRDPAHRDQDGPAWHGGRFAERVRRQWNGVQVPPGTGPGDLDGLARAVQERVGGDPAEIRLRLEDFAALEHGGPPADDPLVRPGAPAG
jgi:hypothetical protein